MDPLSRLAAAVEANDRLLDELTVSRARVRAARTYLDRPGCNARFGVAHLDRCQARHSAIQARLRANREEALAVLNSDTPGIHQR